VDDAERREEGWRSRYFGLLEGKGEVGGKDVEQSRQQKKN
jgi:hypothetical protein